MGQRLHARARTTPEVRREIQNSQESLITLAQGFGVIPKTVEKCVKELLCMMHRWGLKSFVQRA